MIKSLEQIAQEKDFDRVRYGDKSVLLAMFLADIYEQNFRCAKPFGYVVDTDEIDESALRETFEELVKRMDPFVDGKRAGAIYCRSSAHGEYSGSNISIPSLYDEREHEQSWQRLKETVIEVREYKKLKPVLLQNLIGEVTPREIMVTRKVYEYEWPGLPAGIHPIDLMHKIESIPEFKRLTTEAIMEVLRMEKVELPAYEEDTFEDMEDIVSPELAVSEKDKNEGLEFSEHNEEENEEDTVRVSTSLITLSLYVDRGPCIDNIPLYNMEELQNGDYISEMLFVIANSSFEEQGYSRNKDNEVLDKNGNVVLKKGTKVSIGVVETKLEYVIGQTNVAFVARSHDYQEPSMESVKRAWGLTSYLMGSKGIDEEGGNGDNRQGLDLRLKSMIIDYFNPKTGKCVETINLGHDFRCSHMPYYAQRTYEVFSLRNGGIEVRGDTAFVNKFPTSIDDEEIRRIARFYHDKLSIEVEVEGCLKGGVECYIRKEGIHENRFPKEDSRLHVLQITESPLPKDIIAHLTKVQEERILHRETYGRGAINHFGHIIIRESGDCGSGTDDCNNRGNDYNNYKRVTEQFDREGISYLVLGFNDKVTLEKNFLYIATEKSICKDAFEFLGGNKLGFGMIDQHLQGIACQTTFNAAQNGRQGGMFYILPKEIMEKLGSHIMEIDGVKVIKYVHVEACREGLQIYK